LEMIQRWMEKMFLRQHNLYLVTNSRASKCISVWTGLEGKKPNRTELKLIGLNQFSVRLSSKIKKKIGLVVYFGPKPNRIKNAQPYW
jgi:hypothetical protein